MFENNIEGKECNNFMTILLSNSYLKIKGWIYMGVLGVLVKNSLNLISFLPIPPNFKSGGGEWKFEILRDIEKN